MVKIPRKLNHITGFVRSPYGLLPYEDEDDKLKLLALAQICEIGVKAGRIIFKKGHIGAEFAKPRGGERDAAGEIEWHIKKNLFFFCQKSYLYFQAETLINQKRWGFFQRKWVKLPKVLLASP